MLLLLSLTKIPKAIKNHYYTLSISVLIILEHVRNNGKDQANQQTWNVSKKTKTKKHEKKNFKQHNEDLKTDLALLICNVMQFVIFLLIAVTVNDLMLRCTACDKRIAIVFLNERQKHVPLSPQQVTVQQRTSEHFTATSDVKGHNKLSLNNCKMHIMFSLNTPPLLLPPALPPVIF